MNDEPTVDDSGSCHAATSKRERMSTEFINNNQRAFIFSFQGSFQFNAYPSQS